MAVAEHPKQKSAGTPTRKSPQGLIDYMDRRGHTGHLATVYRELCEVTHFGALGMWAAYVINDEEERRFSWTSAPRFRNETALVACGQLDELTTLMERAMHLLGRTMLAEHGLDRPAASTSHDGLERSGTPPSQSLTHPLGP
jgi:hypothetical protein